MVFALFSLNSLNHSTDTINGCLILKGFEGLQKVNLKRGAKDKIKNLKSLTKNNFIIFSWEMVTGLRTTKINKYYFGSGERKI